MIILRHHQLSHVLSVFASKIFFFCKRLSVFFKGRKCLLPCEIILANRNYLAPIFKSYYARCTVSSQFYALGKKKCKKSIIIIVISASMMIVIPTRELILVSSVLSLACGNAIKTQNL